MKKPEKLIAQYGQRVKNIVPLAPFTTYKIGGPAEWFFEAHTINDLAQAYIKAREDGIGVFLLGGGSNILVSDDGFPGLVIRNLARKITIRGVRGEFQGEKTQQTVFVEAESGASMNQLVRYTADEGLAGIHMHLGLPGTVGGAVRMNSKWGKPFASISECIHQVSLLQNNNSVKAISGSEMEFSYGASRITKTQEIILSATFALTRSNPEEVWKIANESIAYRRQTQPQGVKSAGCAFKNLTQSESMIYKTPGGTVSAGFLIDHAGCKGLCVGDACVSDMHANFIVNKGAATASDVLKLMDLIEKKVHETFGVVLHREIIVVGRDT